MKAVKFEIWGDYGHFKKFYTTSSPITFSVPPVTAVYGILGAILGFEKHEYIEKLNSEDLKVAIGIKNPIKKTRMGMNWIETKDAGPFFNLIKQRTQIKVEFLRNPHYILWVRAKDELMIRLWDLLSYHKTIYTPYLGISECIANFGNTEFIEIEEKSTDGFVELSSVIPFSSFADSRSIDFSYKEGRYTKERIPVSMTTQRQVIKYEDILEEINGNPIRAKVKRYWETKDGEKIIFFD